MAIGLALLAPFFVSELSGVLPRARPGPAPAAAPAHIDFLGGILVAMWNYMGWDNASTVAGEVERPRRTYPLAMAGALGLVTLNYTAADSRRRP